MIFIVTELIKGGPYIGPEVSVIFIGVNTNYTDWIVWMCLVKTVRHNCAIGQ